MQIRGTEPRLSNATVNGVHIPGTQSGSRITKLDDVPTDISRRDRGLRRRSRADQDADAIGGSVNLVTKTPEGAPRGYVAGQFGQSTPRVARRNRRAARCGAADSASSASSAFCSAAPGITTTSRHQRRRARVGRQRTKARRFRVEWDQARLPLRSHAMGRERRARLSLRRRLCRCSSVARGAGSRISASSTSTTSPPTATRRRHRPAPPASAGTGATLTRNTSNRTPVEQLFSVNGGGKKAMLAACRSTTWRATPARARRPTDANSSALLTYSGLNYRYDGTQPRLPERTPIFSGADQADRKLTRRTTSSASASIGAGKTQGRRGGRSGSTRSRRYMLGRERSAAQDRRDVSRREPRQRQPQSQAHGRIAAVADAGARHILRRRSSIRISRRDTRSDRRRITARSRRSRARIRRCSRRRTKPISDSLSNFTGGEKVASAYAMHTLDYGTLRINAGLRPENTPR